MIVNSSVFHFTRNVHVDKTLLRKLPASFKSWLPLRCHAAFNICAHQLIMAWKIFITYNCSPCYSFLFTWCVLVRMDSCYTPIVRLLCYDFFGTFELNILVVAVALRELLVYSHPIPVPPSTLTANIFSVLNPTCCCVYQGLLDIQGICSSGYMYRKGVVGGSLSKYWSSNMTGCLGLPTKACTLTSLFLELISLNLCWRSLEMYSTYLKYAYSWYVNLS